MDNGWEGAMWRHIDLSIVTVWCPYDPRQYYTLTDQAVSSENKEDLIKNLVPKVHKLKCYKLQTPNHEKNKVHRYLN